MFWLIVSAKLFWTVNPQPLKSFFFFLQKQNDIHYFKLIKYIRCNNIINIIAKNVKGEFVNKLT